MPSSLFPLPLAFFVCLRTHACLARLTPEQQDWEIQQRRTANIEDEEFDRGFYLGEDGGGADGESGNPFLGDEKKFAAKEAEMEKLR